VCRVLFGAHYVSDVVVGGTIGWVISGAVMGWGTRAR
jgi:membrane-associated phospholipid phosphatase